MPKPPKSELTVYLDHLIRRESLRYQKRSHGALVPSPQKLPWLSLKELSPENTSSTTIPTLQLRKPDFQRATLSWTPEDCVLLLESFTDSMVVPGIVMWTNPGSSYHYILDGAHRVSVVMAWLSDDWGDKNAPSAARSSKQADKYLQAAKAVRQLIQQRIGHLSDFRADYEEFQRLEDRDEDPESMGDRRYKRAIFYKSYVSSQTGFPVAWVEGDYNIAEQSFLRINKSGKRLSPWETRVIEYRNSSAMRVIMSVVATSESAEHYWPTTSIKEPVKALLTPIVEEIHEGVELLRETLLSPSAERPFRLEPQPLMWTGNRAEIPSYLGELLCVLSGHRGLEAEIIEMLNRDRLADTSEVVNNGRSLLTDTLSKLSHFVGVATAPNKRQQNQNKSLGIVPILYFYNARGDYVRSLLYGFIYWMLNGERDDVLQRKRAFCCYRAEFEEILLRKKADPLALVRKSGSGPDITTQTARFFDGVLRALVGHYGNMASKEFKRDYSNLVRDIVGKVAADQESGDAQPATSGRRTFTPTQKSGLAYQTYVSSLSHCGICKGFMNLADAVQHDHVTDFALGGPTEANNQQLVHPFCNNPDTKRLVQEVRARKLAPPLPAMRIK